MIVVSDTGTGMPGETIEHVFEPFFTTKEVGQGTGLGLSQVYGFIKQSNGHIKIYSEVDQGTAVKLYLPRLTGDAQHALDEEQEAEVPPGGSGELILVVEDDEDVRGYSTETLRELGYRVLVAPNGPAGLEMLARHPGIRLLFTDVGLPGGMSGRQLADQARRQRPDLLVLFTTGYARNAIVHRGILDPGTHLLPKPFTHAALATKIRELLDKRNTKPHSALRERQMRCVTGRMRCVTGKCTARQGNALRDREMCHGRPRIGPKARPRTGSAGHPRLWFATQQSRGGRPEPVLGRAFGLTRGPAMTRFNTSPYPPSAEWCKQTNDPGRNRMMQCCCGAPHALGRRGLLAMAIAATAVPRPGDAAGVRGTRIGRASRSGADRRSGGRQPHPVRPGRR